MSAQRRSTSRALCVTAQPTRPREPLGRAAPHRLVAGFAAQMLGQGGVRRGLQGGAEFISGAHSSYQAGGALAAGRLSPSLCVGRLKLSV